jgi:hypothetical protein
MGEWETKKETEDLSFFGLDFILFFDELVVCGWWLGFVRISHD